MKEDLNRILFALMAQVSSGAANGADGGVHANGAGENARQEALRSLLFDRYTTAPARRFSVPRIVREVLDDCARVLPDRIATTVELYGGDEEVFGDRDALRRMATLLAAQAVHAIGDGPGRLFARVEKVDEAAMESACPELGPGTYARLVIETFTGAENAARNALDPLFSVPRGSGGSWNLGLALARKAAWSLGGVICRSSDRSLCTAFLPLSGTLQARSRPSLASGPCSPRLGLGILYVSSEEPILAMGRPSLIESDCCVRVACSGADALRCFEARADEIDVVVIEDDVVDMTGEELASALRDRIAGMPTLVATRRPRSQERDYILRPFSAGDLRAAAWRATVPTLA